MGCGEGSADEQGRGRDGVCELARKKSAGKSLGTGWKSKAADQDINQWCSPEGIVGQEKEKKEKTNQGLTSLGKSLFGQDRLI